jgi:hypothetical protein
LPSLDFGNTRSADVSCQPLIVASEGFYAGIATVAFDAAVKRLVVTKRKHLREYGGDGHARRRSGTPWLEKPARTQNGAHPKISVITSSNEFSKIKLTHVPDSSFVSCLTVHPRLNTLT